MNELDELLRSAYQISLRDGTDTNWEAFARNLRAALLRRAELPQNASDSMAARATCTAKTYRLVALKGENA